MHNHKNVSSAFHKLETNIFNLMFFEFTEGTQISYSIHNNLLTTHLQQTCVCIKSNQWLPKQNRFKQLYKLINRSCLMLLFDQQTTIKHQLLQKWQSDKVTFTVRSLINILKTLCNKADCLRTFSTDALRKITRDASSEQKEKLGDISRCTDVKL